MKTKICFGLVLVLVLTMTLGKPAFAQETPWSITGNANTDPATNFLGTTDNQPLEIRVNNERVLRLEPQAVSPNLIGGIKENNVTPGVEGATIGGGGRRQGEFNLDPNLVTGDFGTVAGGQGNRAGSDRINDEETDRFDLLGNTVGGGSRNTADGNNATVSGGSSNTAQGPQSTVGGGRGNRAGNRPRGELPGDGWATVSGGLNNVAAKKFASVGGGDYNCALAQLATIAGGGRSNGVDFSSGNRVSDDYGTVGGGGNNQAGNGTVVRDPQDLTRCLVTDGGGSTDSDFATVSGGFSNTASGGNATVSGGSSNTASETNATVSGGRDNNASGFLSTIAGGSFSNASAFDATIGGGTGNTANQQFTTISGGVGNTASGILSTIAGGAINTASGTRATVSGGVSNTASFSDDTVGGGRNNNASSIGFRSPGGATVSGGIGNTARDELGVILPGETGIRNGGATVGGGIDNTAIGRGATIPGGNNNVATILSFAAGRRAQAINQGSFVWGDSTDRDIRSDNNNQFIVRASGGVRFFSNGRASVGVQLAPGAGSWSSLSSQNAKTNFAPVDGQSILSRLATVPIQTWNYKSQDPSIRHIGSMAEDLYKVFGVGEDNKHINTVDADGIALASIQGLYQIVQEKDEQITTQQQKIESLEVVVKKLEKAINHKSNQNIL